MALESAHALAALRITAGHTRRGVELPHSDRLVQRSRHEVLARWGESDRVDAISVAVVAFGPFDKCCGVGVPDADALVQTAGRDVAVVRRNCDGGDTIFNRKCKNALILLDIPQANGAVAGARSDVAAVGGEVERVDVLFVAMELVANEFLGNVPNLVRVQLAYEDRSRMSVVYSLG